MEENKLEHQKYYSKEYYSNGQLGLEGSYVDEGKKRLREGKWKWYYSNGKLSQTAYYKNGKLKGCYKHYNLDGELTYKVFYL